VKLAMIKRKRGGIPAIVTSDPVHGGKRSGQGDVQQLLVEQWKRQIIAEKLFIAKQRHLLRRESAVHRAWLDEIKIVSRIGRLRLQWKLGRAK
jgi:hypothetical protein